MTGPGPGPDTRLDLAGMTAAARDLTAALKQARRITVRVEAGHTGMPVACFITGTEPFRPGDTFPVRIPHRSGWQHTTMLRIVACVVADDGRYADVTVEAAA